MALIGKKDVGLLLAAGFGEEELGLVEGGIQGVEIYESPNDYFAHELIQNACESGQCDLMDDPIPLDWNKKEPYDNSHKGIYDDQEYAGNDDWYEDVPVNLREQAKFLRTIKLGKITVWQRRNKRGDFEWPVKGLKVSIPEEDLARYKRLSPEDQKFLWKSYARDEWKKLWESCADSLKYLQIEDNITFKTKNGGEINILVIPADNIREYGYNNLPAEARWITMIYFNKDIR